MSRLVPCAQVSTVWPGQYRVPRLVRSEETELEMQSFTTTLPACRYFFFLLPPVASNV